MSSVGVNVATMWRLNLKLQVTGNIQIAPVTNDATDAWGLFSVSASGLERGQKVILTGPLEKMDKPERRRKKRGLSVDRDDHKDESAGEGCDQKQELDNADKDTLKIIALTEPIKSK
jgi:hypothetical protein